MCAQRRLRSAWASAQSDQSSLCAKGEAKTPRFLHADSEDSDQTGRMPRLISVFAGPTCHFIGFVVCWLNYHTILVLPVYKAGKPRLFGKSILHQPSDFQHIPGPCLFVVHDCPTSSTPSFSANTYLPRPRAYKTVFVRNSAEHTILSANKYENANYCWHFHIY